MNVSMVGQIFPASNYLSGKNMPVSTANESNDVSTDTHPRSKKIDMSNISLNEINALIKSGVSELLDVVPCIPLQVMKQPEYAANYKIDLLGQVEKTIAYNESIGEDTALLEKVLEKIKSIDGMELPASVDTTA
jgi:hypothetical protein